MPDCVATCGGVALVSWAFAGLTLLDRHAIEVGKVPKVRWPDALLSHRVIFDLALVMHTIKIDLAVVGECIPEGTLRRGESQIPHGSSRSCRVGQTTVGALNKRFALFRLLVEHVRHRITH